MVYGALLYSYRNIRLGRLYDYDMEPIVEKINGAARPFFLKTCNRLELYCDSDSKQSLEHCLSDVKRTNERSKPNVGEILFDDKVVSHVFRVASGMDSAILGEKEIIGQIRSALNSYRALADGSKQLICLFENALRVGRKIRREIDIGDNSGLYGAVTSHISSSYRAGDKVAIVGSGNVIKGVLYDMKETGLSINATIFSRNTKKSAALAELFGLNYSDFNLSKIRNCDIVISAIKGGNYTRLSGPRLIIDLSVPIAFSGDNVIDLEYVIKEISASSVTVTNISAAEKIILAETARFLDKIAYIR